jgi:hypothetical protein
MPALTKEQIDAWSKRNKGAFEGLLNVNQFMPVTGDIQSGIMAGQDLSQGNYGSAALNAVGLLPFVPALGGVIKNTDNLFHGSIGNLIGDLRPGKGTLGEGFYLTNTEKQASLYPRLHAKLKGIENPDVVVTPMQTTAKNIYELNDLPVGGVDVNKLKDIGYDGISYNNELMIFDPKNVKILKKK